jgi:LmbE family N-acetylglucosaminyl deacetylase
MTKRIGIRFLCGLVAAWLMAATGRGADTVPTSPAAIQQELRSFATLGSVLHVAAHPDDENTQLITYLARGRGYRTAYLSVTRGDGGQNELGPEFGEKLGLARTQELLMARTLDGGRQFFTRALDFGYTKSIDETLGFWDRQQVVGDIVRVMRVFRPDVVVTRFAPVAQPGNHGHHNTSAVLALEAFKLAGDPKAYPEQLAEGLTPWQPKRIMLNGGGRDPAAAADVRIDVGGTDAVTGDSFASIATRSRAMHKTQFGLGSGAGQGQGPRGGAAAPRMESFQLLAGEPAKNDLMDGIDTTWARFPGGAEIAPLIADAIAQFKTENPAASVPALLAIRGRVAALPSDPVVDDRRRQLDRIIVGCLGLTTETSVAQAEVVPGEPLKIHYEIAVHADLPVKLLEVRVANLADSKPNLPLKPGAPRSGDLTLTVPKSTPISQPYWLREEPTAGMFRVAETKLIGQPENPPPFPVEYVFELSGQKLIVPDEPRAPQPGKPSRRVAVISPVSLQFGSGVALFAPGAKKTVTIEVTAARSNTTGTLQLNAPKGWKISPTRERFKLERVGDKARFALEVTAPAEPTSAILTASAEINGVNYANGRVEINYPHLPLQLLLPPTRLKLAAFDLATRGKKIGYLPGAGDSMAEDLEQMGYAVTTLSGADLTAEKLQSLGLDAVVIGVRAFNEREDLAANLPGLFAWIEAGGTVVAQYNRPNGLKTPQLGPYNLSIAGNAPQWRVTDENSPVGFIAPEQQSAVLTKPNPLGPEDFKGWVQERGAYFPSSWDDHYQTVLAMNDPGEAPLKSGILVTKYGKGYYVYTGLAFFRQLPAGVPGAYRLFANLISLGKE